MSKRVLKKEKDDPRRFLVFDDCLVANEDFATGTAGSVKIDFFSRLSVLESDDISKSSELVSMYLRCLKDLNYIGSKE